MKDFNKAPSSRRSFLKGIGISGASLAVPIGSVQGKSKPADQIKRLLRNGDKSGANEVADDNGLEYSWNESEFSIPTGDNETQDGGNTSLAEPDKIWLNPDDSASRLELGIYNTSTDYQQYAFLNWYLEEASNAGLDDAGSKDGVAISYNGDIFTDIKGEQAGSDLVSDVQPDFFGAKGKFDDELLMQGAGEGWLDVTFQTKSNEVDIFTGIYGEYIHTWYPLGIPPNLGATYPLNGPGKLTVSASTGTESYKANVLENWNSQGQV